MKLLCLSAIIIALTISAYTKPVRNTEFAQFKYSYLEYLENSVKDPTHWIFDNTSLSCPFDLGRPCGITVSDVYFHLDEEGTPILNTKSFIENDRFKISDLNDEEMSIIPEVGIIDSVYIVGPFSTAVIINNRN